MRFLLFALALVTLSAKAGDRIRLYQGSKPPYEYDGYAERQPDGSLRFYDRKSRYTGRLHDGRLIDRKGKVVEKLYRLPD